jgi:hypothetical protein
MPTSQAPAIVALIDDAETLLNAAHDTSDLDELRTILRRPTQVPVSERTYLIAMLTTLSDQLQAVRTLRGGLLDSLRQTRPGPPESPDRGTG